VAARIHGIHFIGINGIVNRFKGLSVDYLCPDYSGKEGFIKALEQL